MLDGGGGRPIIQGLKITVLLEEFVGKLVFDASLCTGCRACELACSFVSEGVFQPSRSRVTVVKYDEQGIDIPLGCMHCENAPCVSACPVSAISTDSETGAVLLDNNVCIGCKLCITVCPFGAIGYKDREGILYKCDLCSGEPECVNWCFTGALKYVEEFSDVTSVRRRKGADRIAASLEDTRRLTQHP